jgi:predicted dehydrogenase
MTGTRFVPADRPARVGIIGSGNIARNHVEGYQAAGAEIVGIVDVDAAVLARRSLEWRVERTFTEVAALLELPGLDAVSVCTPNAAHAPATIAAAAAGIHVLCEKPVSLSLAEADSMIEACERAGVLLQVDHHLRSNPSVERAAAIIGSGELGRITFVRLRQAHDWGGRSEVPLGFRTPALAGGGTLLDNGCHLFDLARHLGGDVVEVYARTAALKFEVSVEDTALVNLRFASGALGAIETSWTTTGWDQAFHVDGTLGTLEYTERDGRPRLRHVSRPRGDVTWDGTTSATWETPAGTDHARAVAAFVGALRGERPVPCTGQDGRAAVRLALAGYESAATGLPVAIPA